MLHATTLLSTVVIGLVMAFVLGTVAHRFKLSPIVGYLMAGVLIGPFTPGYVADQGLATQLAELGVILLMFGVGLHFSYRDLMAVRAIALPGAVTQILIATLLGMVLATAMGWGIGAGLVFGLALSVASTVVLLRALEEHKLVETDQGRIAVGWLVVEDLAMVLALVLLPVFTPMLGGTLPGGVAPPTFWAALALMSVKLIAFGAALMLVGRRVIPKILHYVARTGSRELFRLAVLAIALGVAFGSAELFGVSFALGAFFAGMILAESPLSHQAAEETLPLRDAFAVLFFVSVGMLFNPHVVMEHPWALLFTFLIIVVGKSAAAFLIMRAGGHGNGTSLTISASLAQIGEFSFILAALGVSLGLMPAAGRDLILAGAILSIMVNPFLFSALERVKPWASLFSGTLISSAIHKPIMALHHSGTPIFNHTVVMGYENPSISVVRALLLRGVPVYIIEERAANLQTLTTQLYEFIAEGFVHYGPPLGANFAEATTFILSIPAHQKSEIVATTALKQNPNLVLIGYAFSPEHQQWLQDHKARLIIPPNTDQTSAAALITDAIAGDGFTQARNS